MSDDRKFILKSTALLDQGHAMVDEVVSGLIDGCHSGNGTAIYAMDQIDNRIKELIDAGGVDVLIGMMAMSELMRSVNKYASDRQERGS